MHELSIALNLIEIAAEEARRHGARVVALHLKVGPLAGVVREALVSAYELAREGTLLDDSRLEIEETSLMMNCPACEAPRAVVSIQNLCCSECGEPAMDIIGGRELELIALEIE